MHCQHCGPYKIYSWLKHCDWEIRVCPKKEPIYEPDKFVSKREIIWQGSGTGNMVLKIGDVKHFGNLIHWDSYNYKKDSIKKQGSHNYKKEGVKNQENPNYQNNCDIKNQNQGINNSKNWNNCVVIIQKYWNHFGVII